MFQGWTFKLLRLHSYFRSMRDSYDQLPGCTEDPTINTVVLQAGSRKKTQMYSPVNVHAVFSIQTVKFCTHTSSMCHCNCKDRICRVLFVFFCPLFRQLRFCGNVAHLRPNIFGEKQKTTGGQDSGWACRTRVQISGSISQNGVGRHLFGLLCVKMSMIRHFLQITWF